MSTEAWENPPRDDESSIQSIENANLIPDEPVITETLADPDTEVTPTPVVDIGDLTLAEFIGQFWRAPGVSWMLLGQLLLHRVSPGADEPTTPVRSLLPPPGERLTFWESLGLAAPLAALQSALTAPVAALSPAEEKARQRSGILSLMRIAALVAGLYGSGILAVERVERYGLNVGAPYLLLAFGLWLVTELYAAWPGWQTWWRSRGQTAAAETGDIAGELENESFQASDPLAANISAQLTSVRWLLAGAGMAFSLMTAVFTANNQFTLPGLVAWCISIGLWIMAFAPDNWGFHRLWSGIRSIRVRPTPTFWALVIILAVGTFFRVHDLNRVPPEMTSDHKEKLLDAQRVLDGNLQVFFPNNGGREPFQMYAMALLSQVPGLGMDFTTLKLLSAIEGVVTLVVLWWMGREVIGRDNPQFGNLVGLMLAALVAVSYWHVALSRIGLRIVLTPLVAALLIIYLGRALRDNRRGDYILAGLVLGFGLYAYQAVRMLPVVVVLGVGLAIVFKARTWLERRRYVLHLGVLVVIAVAAFVPMLTFSMQYPDFFWMRTSGRLLGDAVVSEQGENGELILRDATLAERFAAFQENLPVLMSNIRNALLMYNWKGDVLWFSAVPNTPAMDIFTGTLLIVGLAAWLVRMVRRRDVVDWLLPLMLFVMLLPSAFSIAYPIENPSATRTSGTLPEAYLFAALPLALLVAGLTQWLRGPRGRLAGGAVAGLVLLGAGNANYVSYFDKYYAAYLNSTPAPYTEVGAFLRGFADSGGGFGNAFMLGYKYWWDHQLIGMEAGVMDWPGGIVDPDGDTGPKTAADGVPEFLYLASLKTGLYRFDPEKDILFFYTPLDVASEQRLQELFPTGYSQLITSYKPHGDFKIFRVPAIGTQAFIDLVVKNSPVG